MASTSPATGRYVFLLEDDRFELKLDVVGLVETPVVVLIRLRLGPIEDRLAIRAGIALSQLSFQGRPAPVQLVVAGRVHDIQHHEHAHMRRGVGGSPAL